MPLRRGSLKSHCDEEEEKKKTDQQAAATETLQCLRCEFSPAPPRGEWIPVLSFPDASWQRTHSKSTRGRVVLITAGPRSGLRPPRVLLPVPEVRGGGGKEDRPLPRCDDASDAHSPQVGAQEDARRPVGCAETERRARSGPSAEPLRPRSHSPPPPALRAPRSADGTHPPQLGGG